MYDDSSEVIGHNIQFIEVDIRPTYIPNGMRCPQPFCNAYNIQCVHELVNDGEFIISKWGTRWWNEKTYRAKFPDGWHLSSSGPILCSPVETSPIDVFDLSAGRIDDAFGVGDNNPTASMPMIGSPERTHFALTTTLRGKQRSHESAPTYSELMSDHGLLVELLVKRPELAKLWQGLVVRTKMMLCDASSDQAPSLLLGFSDDFKKQMTYKLGSAEHVPQQRKNALKSLTFDLSQTEVVSVSNVPIKKAMREGSGRPDLHRKNLQVSGNIKSYQVIAVFVGLQNTGLLEHVQ